MTLFEEIYKEVITEAVSNTKINKAINGMHPVSIVYDDQDGGGGKGPRTIYPVAFGKTKLKNGEEGNPVIRAFQPSGDTKRGTPKWKYFRVDRIKSWNMDEKAKFDSEDLTGFMSDGTSKTGDDSMSVIYNIAPIGNARFIHKQNKKQEKETEKEDVIDYKPITKDDIDSVDVEKPIEEVPGKKYNVRQIINNLYNTIKNSSAVKKVSSLFNKNVDNKEAQEDINKKMYATETKPISKDEIDAQSINAEEENTTTSEPITNRTDKPITKDEIENVEDNPLTNSFKDMTNRMNNLYKEE